MKELFIEVKDLFFSYDGEKSVLNNVSFDVLKGDTISIVGASGCGKTTLLKVLSGLYIHRPPQLLKFKALQIDNLIPTKYADKGKISYMFQEPTLLPNLTVEKNIEFPLNIKGEKSTRSVHELISTLGLNEYKNTLPNKLSGGMKTRVALGRSFITNPSLLLLDEPFSALDIGLKSRLYLEFARLKSQLNQTAVLVTHDIEEALLLSNNLIIMGKSGQIIAHHVLQTGYTLEDRLLHRYDFLNEPQIHKQYLNIQKEIINDSKVKKRKLSIS
jgi:ABC-type nitrate/sulfonate/bicarbonate transport system ATPase subunit